jgi:transcriptional regulator with XRE-family HTH domain
MADRIKEARKRAGLSQTVLANRLEVSRGAVGQWETGETAPNTTNLYKIAVTLGVNYEWLSKGRGEIGAAPRTDEPNPYDAWVGVMSRLVALEGLVSGLLSLYLATAINDPNFVLARELKKISDDIEVGLQNMPLAVQQGARLIRDALLHRAATQAEALRDANTPKPH